MLNKTQKAIKDKLEEYDVILLTKTECGDDRDLAGRLLNSRALHEAEKKVLVLAVGKNKDLVNLYYTYEFSDRIRMIGGNRQYGGLMNYIELGLLTEEEMYEAVLR